MQPRLMVGAWSLTLGSVAVVGFGVAHGVLPEGSGHAVLDYVAEHPHYAGVHLGSIIGVVLWTMGVSVLPAALDHPTASAIARLGGVCTLVGAAVFVVQFSIDGFGHHALASRWVGAPPDEQASLANTVEVLEPLVQGPAFAWTGLLWGLPLVLFGLARTWSERYPNWLGWSGTVLGAAFLTAAVLRSTLLPDGLVFAGATLGAALWGLVLGFTMWHRSRTPGQQRDRG